MLLVLVIVIMVEMVIGDECDSVVWFSWWSRRQKWIGGWEQWNELRLCWKWWCLHTWCNILSMSIGGWATPSKGIGDSLRNGRSLLLTSRPQQRHQPSFFLDLKTSPFLPPVSLRLSSPPAPRENFLLLHCHHLSDALNLVELDAEKNTTWLLLLEETLLHCWDNTPPPPWNNSLVFKRQVFFPKLIIHIVVSLLRCCFPQNCGNRFSERMK